MIRGSDYYRAGYSTPGEPSNPRTWVWMCIIGSNMEECLTWLRTTVPDTGYYIQSV